jgi:NAD(P)-dependent dehydrogenase (short-subunit alcohol dehydrogenase family)
MDTSLQGKTVLVIGRSSRIARAVAETARAAGAEVVVAGRETVDITDDASIAALAERLDGIDHVISTASARARGTLAELEREQVRRSFDTKVIGPLMLAKHLAPKLRPGGSFVLFSGAAAFKIQVGTLAVAITNGAADTLTRSLAVELAPIRVNAISPGIIDTGAWDGLGADGKAKLFAHATETNPARRIGQADDIADAVLFCLTNTFLTGQTLQVDGGEALV